MRSYWWLLVLVFACDTSERVVFSIDFDEYSSTSSYQVHAWVGETGLCDRLTRAEDIASALTVLPGRSSISLAGDTNEGMEWTGLEVEPNRSVVVEVRQTEACQAWWGCTVWRGEELRIHVASDTARDLGADCNAMDAGPDGDVGIDAGTDGGLLDGDVGIVDMFMPDMPTPDTTVPVPDTGPLDAGPTTMLDECESPVMVGVSTGGNFTCARTDAGLIYCWGANDRRQSTAQTVTGSVATPTRILNIPGTSDAVDSGDAHSCARTSDGLLVYCWGWNNGSTMENRLGVAGTDVGPAYIGLEAHSVSVGFSHACAIEVFDDQGVRCWGNNRHGELGRLHMDMIDTRRNRVHALTDPTLVLTHVSAGVGTGCAWNGSGSSLQCWGYNARSALGFNDVDDHPIEHLSLRFEDAEVSSIQALASTHTRFVEGCEGELAAMPHTGNTCAVADDHLFCWGSNPCGGAGVGNTNRQPIPVVVPSAGITVPDAEDWQLAVGGGTTCVTRRASAGADRELFCWGDGRRGQLLGEPSRNLPLAVPMLVGHDIVDVDVGGGHVCVVTEGRVYCWGRNTSGEAHPGTTADVMTPHCVEL